jgi:hypothetical protein
MTEVDRDDGSGTSDGAPPCPPPPSPVPGPVRPSPSPPPVRWPVPPAVAITGFAIAGLVLAGWAGFTLLLISVLRQLAAATIDHATDVPEPVLAKLTDAEEWSEAHGYEWVGCFRIAASYQAAWRKGPVQFAVSVAENAAGTPGVEFNSTFAGGRELITGSSRLAPHAPIPPQFVVQYWLGASWDELEQFHLEGVHYLQHEAGWGIPRETADSEIVLQSMRDSHGMWVAWLQRHPAWPLRMWLLLPRALVAARRRSVRQRLSVERARGV